MSAPKPFQVAAVDAAFAVFADPGGRRRFLVADEVGLGKTVVAKELARRMSDDGRRSLVIYYIANGHAVSHQNKGRVVGFLGDAQRKAATATPDRLSLIAVAKRPDNPVVIYALTPATSFPGARARLTGGRKEERAFLKVLLEQTYPAFARDLDPEILRLSGDELRKLLTPVMSRTERDSVASTDPLAGTQFLHADPSPEDFQVYRHLADSFVERIRYEALPYWSSVPLPAQSLGPRYAAWKGAKFKAAPKLTRMTRERRNKLDAPIAWPDAKLRALSSVAPPNCCRCRGSPRRFPGGRSAETGRTQRSTPSS